LIGCGSSIGDRQQPAVAAVDAGRALRHRARMRPAADAPARPEDDDRDALPPSEQARDRRRDRQAHAAERAGMRTGLAKQFKQVLDAQVKRAREAEERRAAELAAMDAEAEAGDDADREDRGRDHLRRGREVRRTLPS